MKAATVQRTVNTSTPRLWKLTQWSKNMVKSISERGWWKCTRHTIRLKSGICIYWTFDKIHIGLAPFTIRSIISSAIQELESHMYPQGLLISADILDVRETKFRFIFQSFGPKSSCTRDSRLTAGGVLIFVAFTERRSAFIHFRTFIEFLRLELTPGWISARLIQYMID